MYSCNIFAVTDFSKKSGDFGALSATDIRVIALTYMMEARVIGTDHLKEAPTIKRTTEFYKPSVDVNQSDHVSSKVPGFYMPSNESDEESGDEENDVIEEENTDIPQECFRSAVNQNENKSDNADVLQKPLKDSESIELSHEYVSDEEVEGQDEDDDEGIDEEDDEGWITPGNYMKKKDQMAMVNEKELIQNVEVACMTSDFAMQVRIILNRVNNR